MGCDIYSIAEVRRRGRWERAEVDTESGNADQGEVFPYRNYGVFGFLADVRNYSHSPVIAQPRGLPEDTSMDAEELDKVRCSYHTHSWLTLAELLAYDYDQVFWNRRVTKQGPNGVWDGAALADEGEGEHVTLRAFLGEGFFSRLDDLRKLGDPQDVRVVFWFAT